jgi:hypothetical protein
MIKENRLKKKYQKYNARKACFRYIIISLPIKPYGIYLHN